MGNDILVCLKSILSQNYQAVEALVLDDCSQDNICNFLQKQISDSRIRYFRSERQLGITGGRNLLMQKAQGDIFIVIDDDAFFDNCECITHIVDSFNQNPNVGILAFKVFDCENGRKDFFVPFSKRQLKKRPYLTEQEHLVSYYLGTCHGIRRTVIERCGFYHEDLICGGEELFLASKAITEGFCILYIPDVIVHHFPEAPTLAGKHGKSQFYYDLRGKIRFAYKLLPVKYLVPHLFIWLVLYYGVNAIKERQFYEFIKGVLDGISELKSQKRQPLDKKALAYLKANFGRLWY